MSRIRRGFECTLAAGAIALPALTGTGLAGAQESTLTLHVAPGGNAAAEGTADDPMSFVDALRILDGRGVDAEPVEIVLAGGRYPLRSVHHLGPEVRGTAEHPIVVRAADGAKVVFDGSVALDPAAFAPVDDPAERARLATTAADRIVAQRIDDDALHRHLASKVDLGLVIDGVTHGPARFPNDGYAKLASETVAPEVSPPAVPVGEEDYGVRAGHAPYEVDGRPVGWTGSLDDPRGARARIGDRDDERAGTWEQWSAELARDNRRHRLTGFMDANWLRRSHSIVSADPETGSIHLATALAYGWAWKNDDKPFFVTGLLCELDRPGEWHYDARTRRLFVLPPRPIDESTRVSVPVANGFLHLNGTEHVHVRGLSVENLGSGTAYRIEGGRSNVVSGATIRRSSAVGAWIDGRDNRLVGCDLVALDRHVVLRGGRSGPDLLETGGNAVVNCHIAQPGGDSRRVSVSISGVGQVFANNLVHNSLGQAVTVSGNDHVLERNELFNIGFDEGDGGAIYAGGDLAGYGVVYRHNFIHHLMHVPGKVERSGIHLDDLQAGATCVGNVFYKSAGKGVFMNGGAGHRVIDNVFVHGFRGVYNVGHGARRTYDRQVAIDADAAHPYAGKKEDYVGRVEARIGPSGWMREPWKSRYPLFAEVMEDAGEYGRLWPIRCEVRGNVFCENARGDATIWSRVADEARAKSTLEGDVAVDAAAFVDLASLDLRFVDEVEGVPAIPFASIGLRLDAHRSSMPRKSAYRRLVRDAFEGIPSMPGTAKRFDSWRAIESVPRDVR